MLRDPRFAWASYALFAVAVVAALFKIDVMSEAKPVLMLDPPAKTAASQIHSPLEKDLPTRPLLDLPEPGQQEVARAPVTLGARFEGREKPAEDPSVFRRPSADGSPPGPVCGDLGSFPASSRAVFPLPRAFFGSYDPGWGSPRPQGGHEGTDLMSPSGTPEYAVTDGTVVEVAGANEAGWNRLGGYTVMIRAAYDIGPIRKGDLFYYAHLDRRSLLPIGSTVRAGQRVGFVGDTGQGKQGTRAKFPSHLHFGWYDADETGRRSKAESGAMDSYPLLLWLEKNGGAVSGGTDASYCEAPQGENPAQTRPGERPDMDTGRSGDARPSPAPGEKDDPRHERVDESSNKAGMKKRPPEPGLAPEQEKNREPDPADGSADDTEDVPPDAPPKDDPQHDGGKENRQPPDAPDPGETAGCDKAEDEKDPRNREPRNREPRERETGGCDANNGGAEEPASVNDESSKKSEDDKRHALPTSNKRASELTGKESAAGDID